MEFILDRFLTVPDDEQIILTASNVLTTTVISRNFQHWVLKQPIAYTPQTHFVVKVPSIVGVLLIPMSTAMYCGLQMDGLLSPYKEQYEWTESNLSSPTNIQNILKYRK